MSKILHHIHCNEVPNMGKCVFKHFDTECKIRKQCDGFLKSFYPRTEISNVKPRLNLVFGLKTILYPIKFYLKHRG